MAYNPVVLSGDVDTLPEGGVKINAMFQELYGAIGSGGLPVFNVKAPAYGALGNDSNDDTTALQAAIDAANAASGGIVYFPPGTYRYTSLVWKEGAILLGSRKFNNPGLLTTLRYNGSDGGTGITTTGSGSLHFLRASNISFVGNAAAADTFAGTVMQLTRKLDSHSGFTNCQFQHFRTYGLDLQAGCINTVMEMVRFDSGSSGGYGMRVLASSSGDDLTFRGLESDNGSSLTLTGCGVLHVDTSAQSNPTFTLRIDSGKFEVNANMNSDAASILFTPKQGSANRGVISVFVNGVDVRPGGGITVRDTLKFASPHEFVRGIIQQGPNWIIKGIPSLVQGARDYSISQDIGFLAIQPTTFSNNIASAHDDIFEVVGDINHGADHQWGSLVATKVTGNPTAWTGKLHTPPINQEYSSFSGTTETIRRVTAVGTVAASSHMSGVTASGTSGDAFCTVSDPSKFPINTYFAIATESGTPTHRVAYTIGNVVHFVGGTMGSTVSSQAVSVVAPTFSSRTESWS